MIEFTGNFSGKAKKYYNKIERTLGVSIMLIASIIVSPFWIIAFAPMVDIFFALASYCIVVAITLLAICLVPFDKKIMPKRIYTEDGEYISVVLENGIEEYKRIDEAKIVYDYGEFYAIKFYFGNKSNKFICQKDLITKGTLEEFEALFEGKIERQILK